MMATFAPAFATPSERASPIPRFPPVTTTVLPDRSSTNLDEEVMVADEERLGGGGWRFATLEV
jgi:hypothetical protein